MRFCFSIWRKIHTLDKRGPQLSKLSPDPSINGTTGVCSKVTRSNLYWIHRSAWVSSLHHLLMDCETIPIGGDYRLCHAGTGQVRGTKGNDGCGFICEDYLKMLMATIGVGANASSSQCQQVVGSRAWSYANACHVVILSPFSI